MKDLYIDNHIYSAKSDEALNKLLDFKKTLGNFSAIYTIVMRT